MLAIKRTLKQNIFLVPWSLLEWFSTEHKLIPILKDTPQKCKSVTWSAVPDISVCGDEMMWGAAAPKGPMTYDST